MKNRNKKGFTIVELVIVIGVIGILSAILIPTFANLTNNANQAARKQQVADAYSLYITEAVDGKLDGEYYTRSGTEAPYTYNLANIPLYRANNQQDVLLNITDGNYWFQYGDDGWKELDVAPTPGALVAAPTVDIYNKETGNKYTTAELSTFNKVVVYKAKAA